MLSVNHKVNSREVRRKPERFELVLCPFNN